MAVKMTMAEKLKVLNNLNTNINKKAGKNIVNFASDPEMAEKLRIKFLPTPSLRLNSAFNGWPKGKFSIITGQSDSGKTMHMLETIAYNQKLDPEFIALWVESESSLEESALKMFGIDTTRFLYFEVGANGGEAAMDLIKGYVQSGALEGGMCVINSLKCLTPSEEFEKDFDKSGVAIAARLNSRFMRVIIPLIGDHNVALVAVQHLSTDIGGFASYGGPPMVITGGLAIRYGSMLTIELKRTGFDAKHPLYNVREQYMNIVVTVKKNHCCADRNPYVKTGYVAQIGVGTDITGEVLEQAYETGILIKSGAWIREEDPETGDARALPDGTLCKWNGATKLQEYLDANPDYFEYIKEKVLSNGIEVQTLTADEIEQIKAEEEAEKSAAKEIELKLDTVLEAPEKEKPKKKK
jgi:RecA/RadA recombinase